MSAASTDRLFANAVTMPELGQIAPGQRLFGDRDGRCCRSSSK